MQALSFGGGLAIDIITTLLHVVAIALTVLRLCYRQSTSRLGWDDFTVALAVLLDTAYFSLLWPFFSTTSKTGHGHIHISNFNKYWITVEFFFAIVCLCRMSIALAIARVFPPKEPMYKFIIGLAIFFGLLFVALQITTLCSTAPSISGNEKCQWTDTYKLSYLLVNIISDLVLVGIPLYKLWRVRLPTRQRRLILGGFAAGLIPTIGVIFSAVFQLAPASWEPARSVARRKIAYMQAAVCVAACNLLVVITYFDNVRRRHALDSEQAPGTLQRTESSDTAETRDASLASHSNQVPPSTALTALVLTEITDAYITGDAESSRAGQSYLTSSSFVSSASGTAPSKT